MALELIYLFSFSSFIQMRDGSTMAFRLRFRI